MSKIVKCKICGQPEDERCVLMRVVVEEDGKEVSYCCEQLYSKDKEEI
jgi:hypothetical protein